MNRYVRLGLKILFYLLVFGFSYSQGLQFKYQLWNLLRDEMFKANYPSSIFLVNMVFRNAQIEMIFTMILSSFILLNVFLIRRTWDQFKNDKG